MDAARACDAPDAASPALDRPFLRALLPAPPPAAASAAASAASPSPELKQELSPHAEALALLGDGFVTPPRELADTAATSTTSTVQVIPPSAASSASNRGSKRSIGQAKQRAERQSLAGYHGEEGGQQRSKRVYADRRKGSGDFLRKGQWTTTEEQLARALIEAFEQGYLPVYTGIRLRGYLAVQLQCDPMRISKKLCTGIVDGLTIPKNFGQKKFKLRKKENWDREEASRIIANLEMLTAELWREAPVSCPSFLTLSSTRNSEEPLSLRELSFASCMSPASPGRRLSPSVAKKHKSTVFPIIYLNLSKKQKRSSDNAGSSSSDSDADPSDSTTPVMSEEEKVARRPRKQRKTKPLDGESLQAAYDLLTLGAANTKGKKIRARRTKPKVAKPKSEVPAKPRSTAKDKGENLAKLSLPVKSESETSTMLPPTIEPHSNIPASQPQNGIAP